MILINYDVMWN